MIWSTGMNFSEFFKASYFFFFLRFTYKITCEIIQIHLMLLEESTIIFIIFWDLLIFTKFSFHHKWNEM